MIRAVIADDEAATASVIQYFLVESGAPIEIVGIATDGAQAVQCIRELKPDLVFLDIHMPMLDGFDVMEAVGAGNFIIITAYDSFQNAQQALRHGAKDILHKPISSEQLMTAIMRAMGWQFTKNALTNGILEYLHKQYAQKITLEELSERFHATVSHIARTFKKHVGKSIGGYVNDIRIAEAKKLLADPRKSIQEVALLTGYESVNNFYKYFKTATQLTPAAYRQKHHMSGADGTRETTPL